MNNENQQFEILDVLVLLSFYMQMDDHQKSRQEYKYMHQHLENIEKKLDMLIESEET
jgi:hypothetical protein